MDRRDFIIKSTLAGSTLLLSGRGLGANSLDEDFMLYEKLPRWRGFNLMEKQDIKKWGKYAAYQEQDFELMAEWGFNLIRLPLDYRCWAGANDPYHLDEKTLKQIDQAVEWGKQYNIHISLNMYVAPGYRIGQELTPSLWLDENQEKLFSYYWSHFAERYKGVSSKDISFHLINEPGKVLPETRPQLQVNAEMYLRVIGETVKAIRAKDSHRLIITDGLKWSLEPVPGLVELKIAQSTHWFDPKELVFYNAPWLSKRSLKNQPEPAWPFPDNGQVLDKQWLYQQRIHPWQELEKLGVGVQISAWGILNTVPHEIAIRWMRDSLDLFKQAGWGWALWNFRDVHGFGILDGNRIDIKYESFKGHKVDRQMLELLRKY